MYLRIPILSPLNSGSPDYAIAGQASSFVNWTNLSCKITVNNTVIIDETDLSGYSFGAGKNIACGDGLTLADILNEADFTDSILKLKLNFASSNPLNIAKEATVRIQLGKTGYITYDNTFRVYDYDLGNNVELGTENIDFNLYLINETNNVVSNQQTKPFSKLTFVPIPFTSTIRIYNSVSNYGKWNGTIKIYDEDGDLVLESEGSVNRENIQGIYMVNTLPNGTYDTSPVAALPNYKFKITPVLSHSSVEPVSTSEFITVICDLSGINTVSPLYRNDSLLGSTFKEANLYYKLINASNEVIQVKSVDFSATGSPSVFNYDKDHNNNVFEFNLPSTGAFKVEAEFTAKINTTFAYKTQSNLNIAGVFWFEVSKTSCNEYVIKNSFSDAFTVTIDYLTNAKIWQNVQTHLLDSGESKTIILDSDGIYKFTTNYLNTDYSYIIPSFCKIEKCITDFINKILIGTSVACCADCSEEKDSENIFNFNAIILSLDVYTNLVANYGLTYIFENDLNINLTDLWNLKEIGKRLTLYCTDCSCNDCN